MPVLINWNWEMRKSVRSAGYRGIIETPRSEYRSHQKWQEPPPARLGEKLELLEQHDLGERRKRGYRDY